MRADVTLDFLKIPSLFTFILCIIYTIPLHFQIYIRLDLLYINIYHIFLTMKILQHIVYAMHMT